jgi:DNA-binding beta-propeller fold protein YncE
VPALADGCSFAAIRRMSEHRTLARVVAAVLAVVGLIAAAPGVAAAAAPGSLSFGGCVSEPLSELCAGAGYGLEQAVGVAVSPNGDNVYVAGAGGGAVSVLDRGADGSLTFSACIGGTDSGVDPQCSTSAGVLTPEAVAVSPDGKDVYVLDHGQIDVFARASNGALSWSGCVGDADQTGCAATAPGHTLYPYHYPGAIVVSPDGDEVYTATDDGGGPNGAIDAFARAANGSLTAIGCVDAAGGTESGCATQSPAIVAAGSLAISPAGYLFAGAGDAVASFKIAANGALSTVGCIGGVSGCVSHDDLEGANGSPDALALAPDGSTLYVAAHGSATIDELSTTNGALGSLGCVGASASSGCGATVAPVCGPTGLAVSGDGNDLYALDSCSDTLMTFARAASGAISYQGCLSDTISTYSCGSSGPGLNGPLGLAITPDGSQVLVTGQEKDSVAAFARAAAVAATITISSPADGDTYVVGQSLRASYTCARVAGGDPVSSCAGTLADGATIDTSTAGRRTFTVTATDVAGLLTKQTVSYTVVGVGTPGSAGGEGAGTSAVGGGAAGGGGAGGAGGSGSGARGAGGSGGGGGAARGAGSGALGGVASAGGSGLSVRRFAQSRGRWSEQRGHGRGAVPYGTAFSFVLSRSASVTLTFTTRVGRKTVAAGAVSARGRPGANQVGFYGRVATKAWLAPGTYAVALTATVAGRRPIRASGLTFTIVATRHAR